MGKLTVRAIESAKGRIEGYLLADGESLYLRVAPGGAKTWCVRYMLDGKERQYTLPRPFGLRTDAGHLSLEDARHEAAAIRAKARQGVDHRREQQQKRKDEDAVRERERAASLTVQNLFDAWITDGVHHKDGNKELRRRMEKDVIATLGSRELRTIVESDILYILRAIVERGAKRTALMVRDNCKQMFDWALARLPWKRLIELNPAGAIDDVMLVGRDYIEGEDTRPLADKEVSELRDKIQALRDAYQMAHVKRVAPQSLEIRTELAIWIMLSTCCRVGEIARAKRTDVDLDAGTWIVPPPHSKNADPLTVYLSDFALRQFKALLALESDSEYLFPHSADPSRYADVKSITKQVYDRQLGKSGRTPLKNRAKAEAANALLLSGGGWTPHDLRRTASTIMESLGVLPAVIDRCLNHREQSDGGKRISGSKAKLRRTYQRYDYAREKREAWRLLGERLDLLTRRDTENVIVLKA